MQTAEFHNNRAAFPLTELAKYQGQWIAFDPDGTKVIAAAPSLLECHGKAKAAGFDPENVGFEGVPGPEDEGHVDNGDIN
ncbi:hypothetical protein BH10PLA2_BH10PLA2_28890 [soil metagenome]